MERLICAQAQRLPARTKQIWSGTVIRSATAAKFVTIVWSGRPIKRLAAIGLRRQRQPSQSDGSVPTRALPMGSRLASRDRQVACEVLASIEQSAVKGWIGVQADVRDVVRTYSGDSWTVPVGRHLKATRSYWKASPAEGLACAKADGHAYAEGTLSINWRAIGIVCRSSRPDCRKMASRIAGRHNLPVVFTCEEDTENG